MKSKNLILMFAAVSILLLFCGCAQVGPAMVSPAVYKSSRDVMVANNQAAKLDTELEKSRASAWNQVALNEIQGKATGNGKDAVITADGVLGGFSCIFINDSQQNKTLTIQKVGGFLNGKKFNFELTSRGGLKKYKLPSGDYTCRWTTEYSSQRYPVAGPAHFRVTVDPHFYYGRTGENFHGGYRLYGY